MTAPDLEAQLQNLALTAQAQPPQSRDRRLALQRLVNLLMASNGLQRPQAEKFAPAVYQDIYAEALQDLLLYVCQKIDKYDPSRGTVLVWLNMLLRQRFIKEAIPKILDKPQVSHWALPDLDRLVLPSPEGSPLADLTDYIQADPGQTFRQSCIRGHPDINFQYLMQRRLGGDSWEAIAQDAQIGISTLSSFFYRCLLRFAPQLREHCTHL